jgi:hypothetical protein
MGVKFSRARFSGQILQDVSDNFNGVCCPGNRRDGTRSQSQKFDGLRLPFLNGVEGFELFDNPHTS